MARVDEAMDLYKNICDEIGKESMKPNSILLLVDILKDHHETPRALEILEEQLDTIESSWGKGQQCRAYGIISILSRGMNDFAKSMFISNVS